MKNTFLSDQHKEQRRGEQNEAANLMQRRVPTRTSSAALTALCPGEHWSPHARSTVLEVAEATHKTEDAAFQTQQGKTQTDGIPSVKQDFSYRVPSERAAEITNGWDRGSRCGRPLEAVHSQEALQGSGGGLGLPEKRAKRILGGQRAHAALRRGK